LLPTRLLLILKGKYFYYATERVSMAVTTVILLP
jgi:hypothetical protein